MPGSQPTPQAQVQALERQAGRSWPLGEPSGEKGAHLISGTSSMNSVTGWRSSMREAMTSPSAKQSTRLIEKKPPYHRRRARRRAMAIFAGRVITAFAVGRMGKALRQTAVRLLAWERKSPADRCARGHSGPCPTGTLVPFSARKTERAPVPLRLAARLRLRLRLLQQVAGLVAIRHPRQHGRFDLDARALARRTTGIDLD